MLGAWQHHLEATVCVQSDPKSIPVQHISVNMIRGEDLVCVATPTQHHHLHDVLEDVDYVYLVMELGNGGELLQDFNQRFRRSDPTQRSTSSLYSEAETTTLCFKS